MLPDPLRSAVAHGPLAAAIGLVPIFGPVAVWAIHAGMPRVRVWAAHPALAAVQADEANGRPASSAIPSRVTGAADLRQRSASQRRSGWVPGAPHGEGTRREPAGDAAEQVMNEL